MLSLTAFFELEELEPWCCTVFGCFFKPRSNHYNRKLDTYLCPSNFSHELTGEQEGAFRFCLQK